MCGVIGVLLSDFSQPAVGELLEGCHYLQHRGQDAAGISTCGPQGRVFQCKGNGLARDVFLPNRVSNLVGAMGIAHLRYPTAGSSSNSEAQPFYVNSPYGLVMSHNGNLINSPELKRLMDEVYHRHINTDSDSELLLNLFAAKLGETNKVRIFDQDIAEALRGVAECAQGAYALAGMVAGSSLFAFRDPHGIRPLVYGTRKSRSGTGIDHMFASENIVLEALGYTDYRDVLPGECIVVRKGDQKAFTAQILPPKAYAPCIFEYVYFARPDSVIDGISVYRARLAMGVTLAKQIQEKLGGSGVKEHIDVVIPVPDTANPSALSLATELGIPYREGFVKNRYVGRTFIMPDQSQRRSSVRRKLNANPHEFEGRNVLLVDDSIVRGTTSLEIVQMAREAGAKSVSFASCAPPIRNNHIYGVDLADNKALVAYNRTQDEVKEEIKCDNLYYQTIEDLTRAIVSAGTNEKLTGFEVGVFTGEYVTGVDPEYFVHLEALRATNQSTDNVKSNSDIGIFNMGDN